jgi:hypothetical protein
LTKKQYGVIQSALTALITAVRNGEAESERLHTHVVAARQALQAVCDHRKDAWDDQEQLATLRQEVETFADSWPGDSYDWQYVQNWAKRVLKASDPVRRAKEVSRWE